MRTKVDSYVKKASAKLNALNGVSGYSVSGYKNPDKRRLSVNAFFSSQLAYISWMFHKRELNHKIHRLHERYLRVVYHDRISSFEELLKKTLKKSFLATETFRVY